MISPSNTPTPSNKSQPNLQQQLLPLISAVSLDASNSLSQVQQLLGWRPVLLVGEGSHRTENFFAVQASLAIQAIDRGCKHIFIELPQLWGAELNQILAGGGSREEIKKFVKDNSYVTWNSGSIVSLLETIFDRNQAGSEGEPIQVHGIDPQVHGADRFLEQIQNGESPENAAKIARFRSTWDVFEGCHRQYAAACMATENWVKTRKDKREDKGENVQDDSEVCRLQRTETQLLKPMKDAAEHGLKLAKELLNSQLLSEELKVVVSAIAQHIKIMRAPIKKSLIMRDICMAKKILEAMPPMPSSGQEAPLAVVLAHNSHVAGGPFGKAGGWFSQGMGTCLQKNLRNKRYGDNPCTVICQASVEGHLARLPKEETSSDGSNWYSHGSMIEGELSTVPNELGAPIAVLSFPLPLGGKGAELANPESSYGKIKIGLFGNKHPKEGLWSYWIRPWLHMDLLFLHRSTTAAALE